jgi:hypothetical protein
MDIERRLIEVAERISNKKNKKKGGRFYPSPVFLEHLCQKFFHPLVAGAAFAILCWI